MLFSLYSLRPFVTEDAIDFKHIVLYIYIDASRYENCEKEQKTVSIEDERNIVQKICKCLTEYINWFTVAIYRTLVTLIIISFIILAIPDIIAIFMEYKPLQLLFPIITFIYLYKDFPNRPREL